MPLAGKSDFFRKIQCQVNCGDQRLGVPEVGTKMKVNAVQWKILFFAKLGRFEDLGARHTELAVISARLGVDVMSVDVDAGEQAQPDRNVTPRKGRRGDVRARLLRPKSLFIGMGDSSVATLPQNDISCGV